MKHFTLSIIVAILVMFGFVLGHVTKDTNPTKTIEREKIVHPDFEFEAGDKTYCDLGTEVKQCEIIGKKSSGTYAIKYTHTGIAGGEKIIIINASQILK